MFAAWLVDCIKQALDFNLFMGGVDEADARRKQLGWSQAAHHAKTHVAMFLWHTVLNNSWLAVHLHMHFCGNPRNVQRTKEQCMVKLMVALMELCPRSRVLDIEPKPHEAYYADIPCRDLVPTEASLRTATAH